MIRDCVNRDAPYFTVPPHDRPIRGVVIHSTESAIAVPPHAGGSWHWLVGRAGELYQDVATPDGEGLIAWGARATDRWRPAWVEAAPRKVGVSDINWVSIHLELVSNAALRAAGPAYTDAQYDALIALLVDIQERHGPLYVVSHGEIQADRSDPVGFDWERAGLTADSDGINGHTFIARQQPDEEVVPPPVDEHRQEVLRLETALTLMTLDRDRLDNLRAESERFINELAYREEVATKATTLNISQWQYLTLRAAGQAPL